MKAYFPIFIVAVLCCCLTPGADGQDLGDFYTSHHQEGGTLYFIYPFTGFENSADGSELVFDITYLQGKDSATINFTYYTAEPFQADSLAIIGGEFLTAGSAGKIYIDFRKKRWEHRYGARISFGDLVRHFKPETAPMLEVRSGISVLKYTVKEKKWRTYAGAVEKILFIVSQD